MTTINRVLIFDSNKAELIVDYNKDSVDVDVHKIIHKIPPNNSKLSYLYGDYLVNYESVDGIIYLVITHKDFDRQKSFGFISKLQHLDDLSDDSVASLLNTPTHQLHSNINQVKQVMIDNVDQIISRGDRIDNLVDRTNDMSSQAFAFRKRSTMLRRQMWYKNKRIQLLTGFVGVVSGFFTSESTLIKHQADALFIHVHVLWAFIDTLLALLVFILAPNCTIPSFNLNIISTYKLAKLTGSCLLRGSQLRMNFITSPSQTTPKRLNPLRLHTSLPTLSPTEQGKRIAAYAAVDANVSLDSRVIGIGSGSTVPYVIERIVQQGEANVQRVFIPTGFQSKQLIVQNDLVLGDVDQYPAIDVTLDGADEVDGNLNALKGGGACHLREKVLAEAANMWDCTHTHTHTHSHSRTLSFVIVADERKNSKLLGTTWTQGVPIEVAPFAYAKVLQNVQKLGAMRPTLRMGVRKAGPVVTDNANFVIDAPFSESYYRDPKELLMRIKMLTGVVEVGLFCGMAKAAYFGYSNGSVLIRSADGTVCEQASTRE
ncbi:hypothetical protein E3P89_01747 [Wallemia ichthyophaga]|uniref:Ribose-5-phosphate isomerase n=1 Tax=Wallemia ichthyophaga TaxID=245174 RepID=A0A4T0HCF4_WALIC|nr:hypothetical protein E3P90_02139 [Wallemia ichthyophaga]TIB13320.1 hypothetical protein E3P93_01976 [Wallemia ichthyophaga]TIB23004.1 hypothetical protein E3P89_01747 [Wallemia ichthyophaga]TIB24367.1 hypothetical protein E3P88_02094 [Wallemia ichthyophaga]